MAKLARASQGLGGETMGRLFPYGVCCCFAEAEAGAGQDGLCFPKAEYGSRTESGAGS